MTTTVTHEQTINTSLAEVLEDFGKEWLIRAEEIGGVFEDGGRPDILIEKSDGWPIIIEAEVGNHHQAEVEAQSRLRRKLATNGQAVHTAVALVYPESIRNFSGKELRDTLRQTSYEYAIYSALDEENTSRFPEQGWILGNVVELALILHRSSLSSWRIDALVDSLEKGVIRAEGTFSKQHSHGSVVGELVAKILGQSDDQEGQTRRMAMTVVIDALIFHAALFESEMVVPTSPTRTVQSPSYFRKQGTFLPTKILDEWDLILQINYWPIFHTSGAILRAIPTRLAATLLDSLWETAEELIVGGVTTSHDLTGSVFQRLIADRKFLATYYTRPSAAALLAGLALPLRSGAGKFDWSSPDCLTSLRIGDFACGTGTLLSTAYHRISILHELHGGNPTSLHPAMMERGLVGLDVLTVAVHLTAAMLAGINPNTPFEGECLLTMPYGSHDWGVCVGSLDLLSSQTSTVVIEVAARTAGGRGAIEVRDLVDRVRHGQFDLVIMNPPFTRHGAREGDRTSVHNPAFAAFGADEDEQDLLAQHLRQLGTGGYAHGHAGLASYFVDLADRMIAVNGTLSLVLPLTALSGKSWEKIRSLWHSEYIRPTIVTIAESGTHSRSFSADTGMAECLFIAQKGRPSHGDKRATFVILDTQPSGTFVGEQLAEVISKQLDEDAVKKLEDGPFGGSRIVIGSSEYGESVNCPLPSEGAWQIAGIKDITLAQTAYQLSNGKLWIEGMSRKQSVDIPISKMEDVIRRVGPHHLDITGSQVKNDGLPQGPFEKLQGCPESAAYPCLWNHDARRERQLVIEPDSHCRIREVGGSIPVDLEERAEQRWKTAARLHYNLDLQFNSQSIIVGFTESPSIGGRAWPTLILDNFEHEYALSLWCNSTLGLLCHWWMSNRTQAGRGTSTITSIPTFPTLDLRQLTGAQHKAAEMGFSKLHQSRFLPFDQIDEDKSREELDRVILLDVLGLSSELCDDGGPLSLIRKKIAGEPQIRSDKKTRIVLTDDGEESVKR